MARPAYGGRTTCESCKSIDVRLWHREGRLGAGQSFSCSWTRAGVPSGSIGVRTQADAVVLAFRHKSWGDTEWQWNSGYRSPGPLVTLVAAALGLSVRPILVSGTAGAAWRCCTSL